ncbi:DUF3558 domain-containing protein [Lentzea sp. NPDC006480]|uniref:DUF3558 domain-containing protein n=1 Tax=Lentzea sp. NPDC006480 TaxID=3157176 RepID=UPI0033AD3279
MRCCLGDLDFRRASPAGFRNLGDTRLGCATEVPGRAKPLPNLDLTAFMDTPCAVLTPAQLTRLGDFEPPVPEQTDRGSRCSFNQKNVVMPGYSVGLNTKGISFEASKDNMKTTKVFRETDVAGYPAFGYDALGGTGVCSTVVRASAKATVIVTVVGDTTVSPELKDCFSVTEMVAMVVVTNLKS